MTNTSRFEAVVVVKGNKKLTDEDKRRISEAKKKQRG